MKLIFLVLPSSCVFFFLNQSNEKQQIKPQRTEISISQKLILISFKCLYDLS